MSLEHFRETLPNGLHDAELVSLRVDYALREATLRVNVDVKVHGDTPEPSAPTYLAATIRFSDAHLLRGSVRT